MLDLVGTLEAAELPTGELVVSGHGPVDGRIAGELRDLLVPIAAADNAIVVLDLTDAHGVDDITLEVVARAAHLVRRRGESLRIVTRSPFVVQFVDETGLADIVLVQATLKEALDG